MNLGRSAAKSGRPAVLKPLKLVRPTPEGRMMWVYGNPYSDSDPKFVRSGSGSLLKVETSRPSSKGNFFKIATVAFWPKSLIPKCFVAFECVTRF